MSLNPIVAAEDDENDAEFLKRLCLRCRIKNPLIVVSDGEDVIAYLKGLGMYADHDLYPVPAMLLLDLMMKRVGGLEVLERLQIQRRAWFPVIILTGYHDLSRMKEAYLMGAHSFLLKPLEKAEFTSLVEQYKGIEIERQSEESAAQLAVTI